MKRESVLDMKGCDNRYVLWVITFLCSYQSLPATIDFQDMSSRLVFDSTSAQLLIKNRQKILGWQKLSIVKENGNVPATNWIEGYSNNVTIGPVGATKTPQTNLIVANSNVLASLPSSLPTPTPVPAANSIDGTSWVQYKTKHHVFHDNGISWTSRGYIRFNDGFTIMPRASVLMDTVTSVSGGMDLRDTGTLILASDLYLAHNVTLTNGGNIKGKASFSGQANTIFMGGDLTLAAPAFARTLHIAGDWSKSGTSGDLIIDGCGHTLNIGDRAQIFIDQNVTLTLRNMTIRTGAKSLNNSAIQLASLGSKLALDNVMFDLGADFHFIQGQIFIHNEVAVTGTSAFVYQSPMPSYITSGATWSFEQGTTFSVAPSTLTDCFYTVNSTYTTNKFIVFADASSAMSFNSCSFQTTFTGLRLIKGMVLFDNNVAVNTQAGVSLATPAAATYAGSGTSGISPYTVSWSPDSKFFAVPNRYSGSMTIFSVDGNGVPSSLPYTSVSGIGYPSNAVWSPDGRYIATASGNINSWLRIYRFDGSPTLQLVVENPNFYPTYLSWSPDGRFLATGDNGTTLQVYRFDGISMPVLVASFLTAFSNDVAWSPDGRFISSVRKTSSPGFQIFQFNGSSSLTPIGNYVPLGSSGVTPWMTRWSPDGRFLAVIGNNSGLLQLYRFNGISTPMPVGSSISGGSNALMVTWSSDGRYIASVGWTGQQLRIFSIDGITTPKLVGTQITTVATFPWAVAWSPDGRFLAVTNNPDTTTVTTVDVYRCNFASTPVTNQVFGSGLLFGDSAKGSDFNANVQVLDGATVTVKGMVTDDSV